MANYFKATLAEGNLGHADLGTWRTLAWGLQDTWDSGGMGIRDLVTWGLVGLWIGLGLGDLCTWRTLEWGLQDWCLGDLGTFALRRNRTLGLDLKEFGMGTLGLATILHSSGGIGRKVVTWGLGRLWNGDLETWGFGDLGTWVLGEGLED